MTKLKPKHTRHLASALLMLMALAWLTVSLPFVYSIQQAKGQITQSASDDIDDSSNPFGNSNEEKTESGANSLSEYLHHLTHFERPFTMVITTYHPYFAKEYIDYHPEQFSPPPKEGSFS